MSRFCVLRKYWIEIIVRFSWVKIPLKFANFKLLFRVNEMTHRNLQYIDGLGVSFWTLIVDGKNYFCDVEWIINLNVSALWKIDVFFSSLPNFKLKLKLSVYNKCSEGQVKSIDMLMLSVRHLVHPFEICLSGKTMWRLSSSFWLLLMITLSSLFASCHSN